MAEKSGDLVQHHMGFIERHLATYLDSGGARGHIMDMSHAGVPRPVPTLLLKTIGRRSGRELIAPLIYGYWNGEWVVVGSRGGAPEHPAWYLNLRERPELAFQVATQAFRARWRLAEEGQEREAVWRYMAGLFPPYDEYQRNSQGRLIPLVMLQPLAEVPVFGSAG